MRARRRPASRRASRLSRAPRATRATRRATPAAIASGPRFDSPTPPRAQRRDRTTSPRARRATPLGSIAARLIGAALLAIVATFGLGVSDAAASTQQPPPSPLPVVCSAQSVVFGVTSDMRSLTATFIDQSSGTTVRHGAVALGRLPQRARAIAPLDERTLLAVDDTGMLREVRLSGSLAQGFAMSTITLGTGWTTNQLAYDGDGHLFALIGGRLVRYAVTFGAASIALGAGVQVATSQQSGSQGSGQQAGGQQGQQATALDLADLIATGPNQLLAVRPSGEWLIYDVSAAAGGALKATKTSLGTAPTSRNLVVVGGRLYGQTADGALVHVAPTPGPTTGIGTSTASSDPLASGPWRSLSGPSLIVPSLHGDGLGGNDSRLPRGTIVSTPGNTVVGGKVRTSETLDEGGWTQTLLATAPSTCSSVVPAAVGERAVGRSRGFNGFGDGWCTEGAAALFFAASGRWMDISGDAWEWAVAARSAGWTVTAQPDVRAVVVFQPNVSLGGEVASALGHVAWVDGVRRTDAGVWFHIWEMNGPAGRGQWSQLWVQDNAAQNGQTGQPNMQFILAP